MTFNGEGIFEGAVRYLGVVALRASAAPVNLAEQADRRANHRRSMCTHLIIIIKIDVEQLFIIIMGRVRYTQRHSLIEIGLRVILESMLHRLCLCAVFDCLVLVHYFGGA